MIVLLVFPASLSCYFARMKCEVGLVQSINKGEREMAEENGERMRVLEIRDNGYGGNKMG